jgi:excinuclease ABC subunit A
VLDEPTTGLHFADIHKLLHVLQRLVTVGNTVLVIEHNLDVIKTADYLIDLGPEGGDRGGEIVGTGTPEELAANPNSYTGEYLRAVLADERAHGIHVDAAAVAAREQANLKSLDDLIANGVAV